MNDTTRRLGLLLAILAALNGCVSVRDQENKAVDAGRVAESRLREVFTVEQAGSLRIQALVYHPKRLPLEDFFRNLASGRYEKAFKSNRFRSPAATDDEALRILIKAGLIPVLVDATNVGKDPVDASSLTLTLEGAGAEALTPIPGAQLPYEFEKLNPKAIAANAYNTTVVVVGYATLVAALAVAAIAPCAQSRCDAGPLMDAMGRFAAALDPHEGPVLNHIHKTTVVEYGDLLWKPRPLAPGQTATGLLFFRATNPDWDALRLRVSSKD